MEATDRPFGGAGYRITRVSSIISGVRDLDHSASPVGCNISPDHGLCGERGTSSGR